MKNIKAILVDDEIKLRKVLKIKLEQYCPEVLVVASAGNVNEAYEKIVSHRPQLVFLDIAMPGGSGFDLFERFEKIEFEVVFVTGFNDYVLDALKVSAVDYLLKPIITEDLINSVAKAKERIENREKVKMYHLLKHNVNHIGEQDSKIVIPGSNDYNFVHAREIIRCEGWQRYTRIHLADGNCIVSSYNIGVFKDMLETYGFYSTHKSHLINTKLISKYLKDGKVIMSDQSVVPVSRRKKEDFINKVINDRRKKF